MSRPASGGHRVGKGCSTRSENECTDEQGDRTAEATDAAILGPYVLGTPRVGTALAELRPNRRLRPAEYPLPIHFAVKVASPPHDDRPERVKVTVNVTP